MVFLFMGIVMDAMVGFWRGKPVQRPPRADKSKTPSCSSSSSPLLANLDRGSLSRSSIADSAPAVKVLR